MVAMFIVGILFGWLLEALFVKFVLGKPLSIFTSKTATRPNETESAESDALYNAEADQQQLKAQAEALQQCDADKAALSKALAAAKEQLATEQAAHEKTQHALAAAEKLETGGSKNPTSGSDDLTKLAGIGPKIAASMKAVGIDSFTKIAGSDVDALCEELTKNNIPYSKANVSSWAEQAKYADQGDWQGLKSYQDGLKS